MAAPTPKDDWLVKFAAELVLRLRPTSTTTRFARTIAATRWPLDQHMKPDEAALRWHRDNPQRRSTDVH